MEEMTKEEMQKILNREAEQGSTEYEALKALVDILGISFPKIGSNIRGGCSGSKEEGKNISRII